MVVVVPIRPTSGFVDPIEMAYVPERRGTYDTVYLPLPVYLTLGVMEMLTSTPKYS